MCAPRLTRHTSIRYSSSCHTRVKMGAFVPLVQPGHVAMVGLTQSILGSNVSHANYPGNDTRIASN
jgi:hypothetical protein